MQGLLTLFVTAFFIPFSYFFLVALSSGLDSVPRGWRPPWHAALAPLLSFAFNL